MSTGSTHSVTDFGNAMLATVSLSALGGSGEVEIAGRRYVRQRRLASILGVTARTLARWNARGIGPPKITIGKTVLFDLAKLPEWLATRESNPTRTSKR
jgi:predicted DNA-binding transcriptional regulator AlpA